VARSRSAVEANGAVRYCRAATSARADPVAGERRVMQGSAKRNRSGMVTVTVPSNAVPTPLLGTQDFGVVR